MGIVTFVVITRRQSPAIFTVSLEFFRIVETIGMIDQRMVFILLPVIGVSVFQPSWIQSQERIMREEQRTAIVKAQWQFYTVKLLSIFKEITDGPTAMINR